MQVLGNIYFDQGKYPEALAIYNRAATNYGATVGINYHRTGHLFVKIADCHAKMYRFETAG